MLGIFKSKFTRHSHGANRLDSEQVFYDCTLEPVLYKLLVHLSLNHRCEVHFLAL